MRQVTRKGLITVAAAGGVLAGLSGGTAYADTAAQGTASGSGILSGNNIQAPIEVPVNLCGNTVNVVGALNPASGAACGESSDTTVNGSGSSGTDSDAQGSGGGIASGNNVQAPVNVPVNVCGNGVNALTTQSPAASSECGGGTAETPPSTPETPETPDTPEQPPADEEDEGPGITPANERAPEATDVSTASQPEATGELAHTGAGADTMGVAAAASAGLLVGGFVLYRRGRVARR